MSPTNQTALDEALADELEELVAGRRTSIEGLATRAANLRIEFLDQSTNTYDLKFVAFWKRFGMRERFGSLANFTKYAAAGTALKTANSVGDGRDRRYPGSLTALYEISLLTPEETELCLSNRVTRSEVTENRSKWDFPVPPTPLITPAVSASAIAGWRKSWRSPSPNVNNVKGPLVLEVRLEAELSSVIQKSGGPSQSQLDQLARDVAGCLNGLPGVILANYSDTVLASSVKKSSAIRKRELSQLLRRERRRDALEALMFPKKSQAKLKAARFIAACRLVGIHDSKIDDNPGKENIPSPVQLQARAHEIYKQSFGERELANSYYRKRQSYIKKDDAGNLLRGFEIDQKRAEIIRVARLAKTNPGPDAVLEGYSGSLEELPMLLTELPDEISVLDELQLSALCRECLTKVAVEFEKPITQG